MRAFSGRLYGRGYAEPAGDTEWRVWPNLHWRAFSSPSSSHLIGCCDILRQQRELYLLYCYVSSLKFRQTRSCIWITSDFYLGKKCGLWRIQPLNWTWCLSHLSYIFSQSSFNFTFSFLCSSCFISSVFLRIFCSALGPILPSHHHLSSHFFPLLLFIPTLPCLSLYTHQTSALSPSTSQPTALTVNRKWLTWISILLCEPEPLSSIQLYCWKPSRW